MENFCLGSVAPIKIPGIQTSKWYNQQLGPKVEERARIQLPGEEGTREEEGKFWEMGSDSFVYVKLHGSYGWRGHDGSDTMVIGNLKTRIIEKEPLLKFYMSLFEGVLNVRNRNLVVIGYGFGDPHINERIANAVRDRGLRLHVVLPMGAEDFKEKLRQLPVHGGHNIGDTLWGGLSGYHQAKVTDFYQPYNQQVHDIAGLTPRGHRFCRILGLI